jgi:hypothetical protein
MHCMLPSYTMSAVEIPLIIIDIVALAGSGAYYYAYIKDNEHAQQSNPNFVMKCLFPGCTVFSHQGFDYTNDTISVCCLGSIFTVFCWEPKNAGGSKVYAAT